MNSSQLFSYSMRTLTALFAVGVTAHAVAAAPSEYVVSETINLGATSRWDYAAVDADRHHLFVTRGDRVQVLDTQSGNILGEVSATPGVHGVAFAPALKLGFTSNGKSNSVTVFDLDTFKTIREIKGTGSNPDAILFDGASGKLFVFNGHSASISIIDTKTMAIVQTSATSGKPEFAVSDGAGRIYFNIEMELGAIEVLDVATGKVVEHWNLEGCSNPSGLAIDAAHSRLFSVCENGKMVVTDTRTGAHVAELPVGEKPDAAWFDIATQTVFSSNGGSATLTAIREESPNAFKVIANVPTAKGARTMAADAALQKIFLPTGNGGEFLVLVVTPK